MELEKCQNCQEKSLNVAIAKKSQGKEILDETTKKSINNLWIIHDHDYIISLSSELKSKKIILTKKNYY